MLDGEPYPAAVVGGHRGQRAVLDAAVDEHDRLPGVRDLDSSSWSSRAVAVMKPSTWRARIASKSMRSRSGALSVLAISDV